MVVHQAGNQPTPFVSPPAPMVLTDLTVSLHVATVSWERCVAKLVDTVLASVNRAGSCRYVTKSVRMVLMVLVAWNTAEIVWLELLAIKTTEIVPAVSVTRDIPV